MQIGFAALSTHLQKGLKTLYAVHGDEALLQLQAQDLIRHTAQQQGFSQRAVFTVQGSNFDWGAVLNERRSIGLFSDKKLIELRIPTGKPGKDGSIVIQQLAEQAAAQSDVLTLITLPRIDKATQSSSWFTALERVGVSIKIDPVERHALPEWIAKQLQAQGQWVQSGAQGQKTLQFFADRVEGNLLAAFQEVQKLGLLYPKGELDFRQIEVAVLNVARYDVFKLSHAVLAGDATRTQRMIDGLQAEGVAAVLVHWALAEDIRTIWHVMQGLSSKKPLPVLLREHRVWGPKEKQLTRIVERLSVNQAYELLVAAHQVDGVVKGLPHPNWPSDPWQALHRLAYKLAQQAHG